MRLLETWLLVESKESFKAEEKGIFGALWGFVF